MVTKESDPTLFTKKCVFAIAISVTMISICITCYFFSPYSTYIPSSAMSDKKLALLSGITEVEVKKWPSCYRAYREYEFRLRQWQKILKQKFDVDLTNIDFSLPGQTGFGDKADLEFFNSRGGLTLPLCHRKSYRNCLIIKKLS